MPTNYQTRWFCSACQREWVDAVAWKPEDGCPACRSTAIEQVTYAPVFPGSDIPREKAAEIAAEPAAVAVPERNWAVELSES